MFLLIIINLKKEKITKIGPFLLPQMKITEKKNTHHYKYNAFIR